MKSLKTVLCVVALLFTLSPVAIAGDIETPPAPVDPPDPPAATNTQSAPIDLDALTPEELAAYLLLLALGLV